MSIYRHFEGNLYFLVGYATRFAKEFHKDEDIIVKVAIKAKYEETLEDVEVALIYDKNVGATFYVYKNENLDGVMAFYKGLDGQYWLKPREQFHENVLVRDKESGDFYNVPRFEKVANECLFDSIAELIHKKEHSI